MASSCHVLSAAVFLFVVAASVPTGQVEAAAAGPLFRVGRAKGDIGVRLPDQSEFRPVEEGKSYPSGSSVRVGLRSFGVIQSFKGSECVVTTGTVVTVKLDGTNQVTRLALEEGRLDIRLDDDLPENSLIVETALMNVMGALRRATVEVQTDPDWKTVAVEVKQGRGAVNGRYFRATDIEAGRRLGVMCSLDRLFLRIRATGEAIPVAVSGKGGDFKTFKLEADGLLKMVLEPDGSALRLLRALQIAADGRTIIADWDGAAAPADPAGGSRPMEAAPLP